MLNSSRDHARDIDENVSQLACAFLATLCILYWTAHVYMYIEMVMLTDELSLYVKVEKPERYFVSKRK